MRTKPVKCSVVLESYASMLEAGRYNRVYVLKYRRYNKTFYLILGDGQGDRSIIRRIVGTQNFILLARNDRYGYLGAALVSFSQKNGFTPVADVFFQDDWQLNELLCCKDWTAFEDMTLVQGIYNQYLAHI